ncbi:ubiquinone biosynthesis protein coq-4 [Ascodesmis nigricans]|uniref:4-hydroxy-3-methoxy-5-polyprenylbenzoate decarboxylase n=1 Tax=Ascodesmis nigricans TaxID=341454 RepID=A0A4S2N1G9_9PEZI|nr:ubiquinone biosynthesis protein coq-4 [Ascodesmis nigricans]
MSPIPPTIALRPLAPPHLRIAVRGFSVLSRPPPAYPHHVPLTTPERILLGAGSAIVSLINPRRADMIATCGETTATPYFIYRLRDAMLSDPVGRRILKDRPRITSKSLNLEKMRAMRDGTVGREYVRWLDREGVSPDTRTQVRYIDDPECAYVMQRYRECHDFYHALTGLPVVREGEVALKAFEFCNTLIPMTGLSMFAAVTLKKDEKKRIWDTYFPWAIRNGLQSKEVINIYWEEELETDVVALRERLGIEMPPDMRQTRAAARKAKKKTEKTAPPA